MVTIDWNDIINFFYIVLSITAIFLKKVVLPKTREKTKSQIEERFRVDEWNL